MIIRKNWIFVHFKNWIYINISNPKKTMNKLKGIFKPLKCYFRFSNYDYNPILWLSNISFIHIVSQDVGWKDKYDSPRFEQFPYVWIHIYKWNWIWYWSLPPHQKHREDEYWEQALWYLYYYNNISYGCNEPSIEKAKESWPWQNYKTGESTWTNEFLVK